MKRLIPFLCVFMYFMSPYRMFGYAMPEIIGLIATMFAVINGYRLHLEKSYLLFFIYMLIIPPIVGMLCGILSNNVQAFVPMGLILYSIFLGYLLPDVDKKYILKCYKFLVYLAIGFFLVQEFSYFAYGYRFTFYLDFFEMYYEETDIDSFAASRAEMNRSSSFFLEPSHFVQYIMPYFCIALSKYINEKKGLKEVLFMTLVLVWSKAGVGYVSLFSIAVFFFFKNGSLKMYQRIIFSILAIICFWFITTFYANNEFIASIIERTSELSMEVDASGAQSGFIRIWRGYFIYGAMDIVNQIFGVSLSGIEAICNAVYIPGSRYDGTYMNGIQSLLISGGLIGLGLFFNYIFNLFRKMEVTGQCILVAMITIFFMEHMLNTPKMFLYILLSSCFIISENKTVKNYRI